jgi:membrane fusion protein, multidrug efflux system
MNKHIFIALYIILLVGCKKEEKTTLPVQPKVDINNQVTLVKTTKVSNISDDAGIQVLGAVMSDKEARPSFKTGGVIAKTYLQEGDYVKKGQLLATLVMSEIDAQINQAQQVLSKSERDYNRVKNLHADSVATLEQLQNVTTALELAKKTVEIANFNRKYSEVRSPINGRIVKQVMHDGEIVGPGMPIYGIMGNGAADWKINAGLIDRDWANVKIGDKGKFILDAYPNVEYDVVVSDKSSIGGNATSTIDIELRFIKQPAQLAVGLLGKIFLSKGKAQISNVNLAIDCLTKMNGSIAKVFVHENGIAKLREIKIGKILGEKVEVISGLTDSDEVISIGSMFLEDGDKVKVSNQ